MTSSDYNKVLRAFCKACPRREECLKEHYDPIENYTYPVNCDWLNNFDFQIINTIIIDG